MIMTLVFGGIIAVFIFVVGTSGVICKEHSCVSIVNSGSLRLEGGRSTRDGTITDGYVAIAEENYGPLVGYVCSTDEETKQLQGNAICHTLGFEKAYDMPKDHRYGKPLETLQSYKLNCTYEDSLCILEETNDCTSEKLVNVWCIKDYSVRLVTDDKEKFLDSGFFVYYLNFTWYKVHSHTYKWDFLCMEYGFAKKDKHERRNNRHSTNDIRQNQISRTINSCRLSNSAS
ncbi:uncharacterized protein LOC117117407 isoform X1 [Anneissia japonica]|uniref:uncharacterized protein LOC117117407 isoform X1 n=1 Tax=Anneissia japonica TaxID=1529436 RepID=UPI00142585A3|nr:uncharacterized protein LOC117117407 isoform X1 [Anneissia japonica]XP_033117609.1 uncharacterized protein LOC117117407 isoform X1 [Anneissia japonica]